MAHFKKHDSFLVLCTNWSSSKNCSVSVAAHKLLLRYYKRAVTTDKPYEYRLAINHSGSRTVLMEVLALAKERLILVCPWPNNYAVDSEVIWKLEELMKRKVHIAIGWGYLRDINKASFGFGSMRQWLKSSSILYRALPKLEALEQKYLD